MERKHIFLVVLSKFCHRSSWSGVKDFRWSSQSSVRGCVHLLEQRHLLRGEPQFHLLLDTHRLRDQIWRRLYMPPCERDMNVQQFRSRAWLVRRPQCVSGYDHQWVHFRRLREPVARGFNTMGSASEERPECANISGKAHQVRERVSDTHLITTFHSHS